MGGPVRVAVRAGFDMDSYAGAEAAALALELSRGFDVVLDPLWVRSGLPAELALLLTKDPEGPVDVSITFGPPHVLEAVAEGGPARLQVGWPVWDGEGDPARFAIDGFGLIVGQSPEHVERMQDAAPRVPYAFCPLGVQADHFPVVDRSDQGRPLTVGVIGPVAEVVDAWELAECPPGSRLLEVPAGLDRFARMRFWAELDLLVCSEYTVENDRACVEFMATGGPVAAEPVGGHMNWLHPDSSYAVDLRAGSVELSDVLARACTRSGRTQLRRKGEVAARMVRADLSWEQVVRRLMRQIVRAM